MQIIFKNILRKANHFIILVKQYYNSLCQVYNIIIAKLPRIKSELTLQMFFKPIINLIRSNNLVLIFLVFGIYLYITNINIFLSNINQRNIAINKNIDKVKRFHAFQQVNYLLNTQNDSLLALSMTYLLIYRSKFFLKKYRPIKFIKRSI